MGIFYGLIIAPAAVLVLWYVMPVFKTLMIGITSTWGAAIGLEGLALFLADAMPLIVPLMCVSGIIAGLIFLARTSRMG